MSLQLSYGDICSIWNWSPIGNHYFDNSEKINEMDEIGLVTHTPDLLHLIQMIFLLVITHSVILFTNKKFCH